MKEVWKDIKGYEGIYQVSNLGRVKRIGVYKNQFKEWGSNRILKYATDKEGYLQVALSSNGKSHTFKVHRLVSIAFIPNPKNLPQINHKNEIKSDNRVDNLEWCSPSYNVNYGTRNEKQFKKIEQLNKGGKIVKEWNSIKEASDSLNIDASHIVKCCKGKIKTAYGFVWRYK